MCSSYSPDSSEKYAMDFPSGDHAGSRSATPGVLVMLRMSPLSARAGFGQIIRHANFHRMLVVRREIVNVNGAELFVDDCAGACGHVLDRQAENRCDPG